MAEFPPELKAEFEQGLAFFKAGEFARAAALFDRVAKLAPRYPGALANLALSHFKRDDFDAAENAYRRALEMFPGDAEIIWGLGTAVHEAGRLAEACDLYRTVLKAKPQHVPALHNLGNALRDLGRFDEAVEIYRAALASKPDHHMCRLGYSAALFYRGDWEEAWRMFEARLDVAKVIPSLSFQSPKSPGGSGGPQHWKGGPQPQSLLVIAEQGRGDTIQFARFLPALARNGRVSLLVGAEMFALLRTLDAPIELVPKTGGTVRGITGWVPLLSVPLALGLRPEALAPRIPYLAAEEARVARWRERLGGSGLKVGIAWQGNPEGSVDRGRSLPLAAFAPLAALPGVRLFSLQKGFGAEQAAKVPFAGRIETLGDDFDAGPDAFLDSAAAMMSLDLVISTDTAIAHLAGALGRPLWVLLKQAPNWRWLYHGETNPFYPTARLFRQEVLGDWRGVMARVARELAGRARL